MRGHGISAARAGRRTLIVSTDPAPSLGDALRQPLGASPAASKASAVSRRSRSTRPPRSSDGLPPAGAARRDALRGTWLDRDDVARLLRLSLPGIDEIAALLELADFSAAGKYDCLIVDTAPTGHMLRMLAMPALLGGMARVFDRMQGKHRILVNAIRGGWTHDAADMLDRQHRGAGGAHGRHPARRGDLHTGVGHARRADVGRGTRDALKALRDDGVAVNRIVVNRLTQPPPQRCAWCSARRRVEQQALGRLEQDRLPGESLALLPAMDVEPRGLPALARIARVLDRPAPAPRPADPIHSTPCGGHRADRRGSAVPQLATGNTKLVMFGGKGGVGKTTCAAAAAIRIAAERRRPRVFLLSTDPAHSLGESSANGCRTRNGR